MEISHKYDDIIALPHHVSETHAPMPLRDRAAQFSPFAALTGYEAAIEETARYTEDKRELSEEEKQILSVRLAALEERAPVSILFFQPDARKDGGAYRTVTGTVKKIDVYRGTLGLADGTVIPIDDILHIE